MWADMHSSERLTDHQLYVKTERLSSPTLQEPNCLVIQRNLPRSDAVNTHAERASERERRGRRLRSERGRAESGESDDFSLFLFLRALSCSKAHSIEGTFLHVERAYNHHQTLATLMVRPELKWAARTPSDKEGNFPKGVPHCL